MWSPFFSYVGCLHFLVVPEWFSCIHVCILDSKVCMLIFFSMFIYYVLPFVVHEAELGGHMNSKPFILFHCIFVYFLLSCFYLIMIIVSVSLHLNVFMYVFFYHYVYYIWTDVNITVNAISREEFKKATPGENTELTLGTVLMSSIIQELFCIRSHPQLSWFPDGCCSLTCRVHSKQITVSTLTKLDVNKKTEDRCW